MTKEHRAMASMRRYVAALLAHDWNDLADGLADDVRFEDRRQGMKTVLDKAGTIAQLRVMAELGEGAESSIDVEVIETRGDGLALVRQIYRAFAYTIPLLGVIGLDEDGRMRDFIVFDESDLDPARAELEALTQS